MRDELKPTAAVQGFLEPVFKFPVSFGGQRFIQLSYGRLWASIDQTPASGNALDIAGYCSIGLCVKAPAAKVGRSNRLGRASRSRAAGVPGAGGMGRGTATKENLTRHCGGATAEDMCKNDLALLRDLIVRINLRKPRFIIVKKIVDFLTDGIAGCFFRTPVLDLLFARFKCLEERSGNGLQSNRRA